MKIQYTLSAEDFVAFQMLAAGRNPNLQSKMRLNRWMLSGLTLAIAGILAFKQHWVAVVAYTLAACAIFVAYPHYYRWRHKRHYTKWVQRNYAKRFGQVAYVEFAKRIHVVDDTTDAHLEWKGMDVLIETNDHLFGMLGIGGAIILPKAQVDASAVRELFIDKGVGLAQSNGWDREF